MLEHYNEVIQDQLDKNIIKVVEEEPAPEVGKVHYLPHHEVVRLDKSTTKVRVVFDASSKKKTFRALTTVFMLDRRSLH